MTATGNRDLTNVEALVFDFDGTILDTETPVFEAWRETFEHFGATPITFDEWVVSIGLSSRPFDPVDLLEERTGVRRGRAEVIAERMVRRDTAVAAMALRPGIRAWFEQSGAAGIPMAVASSSPREWVEGHLVERGVRSLFTFLGCAGDPLPDNHPAGTSMPGKPDPTSYQMACEALGANPARSIAIEDSPHGVTGANAAGLFTVAVPGPMTAHMNFDHADLVLGSLAQHTVHEVGLLLG